MQPSGVPLSPGDVVGKYVVVRPLGQGGMGLVFEVRHQTLSTRAALKILWTGQALSRELVGRFLTEARASGAIEHPSVVRVLEYDALPNGTPYMLMEFLAGETLQQRLQKTPRLGPECLPLLYQIADTLAFVHGRGIVHRDLKPSNLMLVPDPAVAGGERVKLLDFGIAKILGSAESQSGLVPEVRTADGALLGTPGFMAPELWQGAGAVDEKTDVYALGVIAYQALSGRALFETGDAMALMYQHMTKQPTPLGMLAVDLPEPLLSLVADMLQKDKALRPTMRQVADTLARLIVGSEGRPATVADAVSARTSAAAAGAAAASSPPALAEAVTPQLRQEPASDVEAAATGTTPQEDASARLALTTQSHPDAPTLSGTATAPRAPETPTAPKLQALAQPSQMMGSVALPDDHTLRENPAPSPEPATQRHEPAQTTRAVLLALIALVIAAVAVWLLRG